MQVKIFKAWGAMEVGETEAKINNWIKSRIDLDARFEIHHVTQSESGVGMPGDEIVQHVTWTIWYS